MALVSDIEIRDMWASIYQLGNGKEEIKTSGLPSRSERRADFQAAEGAILTSGLNIETLVQETTEATSRHQAVKVSLDGGRIPDDLVPVIEDYLMGVFDPIREVDTVAVKNWVGTNINLFNSLSGTLAYKALIVGALLERRVQEAL